MSTAARKARKRAGVKFEKAPKVGTPFQERAWFLALVPGPVGIRHAFERMRRSKKKLDRALRDRGIEVTK